MKLRSGLLTCLLCLLPFAIAFSQSKPALEKAGEVTFGDADERIMAHKFFESENRLLLVGRRTIQLLDVANAKFLKSHPIETILSCEDNDRVISPDGRRMLVFGDNDCHSKKDNAGRPATIWDLQTGKQIAVLDKTSKPIRAGAWSKNGKTLVSSSVRHNPYFLDASSVEVTFWDGETFEFKNSLPTDKINWWYLTDDGDKCLFSVGPVKNILFMVKYISDSGGPIRVWDTNSGTIDQTILDGYGNTNSKVRGISLSPDERFLTFLVQPPKSKDRRLTAWEGDKTQPRKYAMKYEIQPMPKLWEFGTTFSPDGKYFALPVGKNVQIYETSTGEKRFELAGVKYPPTHWLDDNKILLFGYNDKLEAWDTAAGRRLYQQELVFVSYYSDDETTYYVEDSTRIVSHPNRSLFLTYSKQYVKVCDARTGNVLQTLVSPPMDFTRKKPRLSDKPLVTEAAWSGDGKTLYVIGSDKRSVSIWHLLWN